MSQYETGRVTLGGQTVPEVIKLAQTSRNFFSVLGVGARVGYFFSPAADVAQDDNVVVLSHGLWRRQFNEDPAVVGGQVTLNGRSFTVIGVMPSDFLFLVRGRESDAWIPLVPDDTLIKSAQTGARRNDCPFEAGAFVCRGTGENRSLVSNGSCKRNRN